MSAWLYVAVLLIVCCRGRPQLGLLRKRWCAGDWSSECTGVFGAGWSYTLSYDSDLDDIFTPGDSASVVLKVVNIGTTHGPESVILVESLSGDKLTFRPRSFTIPPLAPIAMNDTAIATIQFTVSLLSSFPTPSPPRRLVVFLQQDGSLPPSYQPSVPIPLMYTGYSLSHAPASSTAPLLAIRVPRVAAQWHIQHNVSTIYRGGLYVLPTDVPFAAAPSAAVLGAVVSIGQPPTAYPNNITAAAAPTIPVPPNPTEQPASRYILSPTTWLEEATKSQLYAAASPAAAADAAASVVFHNDLTGAPNSVVGAIIFTPVVPRNASLTAQELPPSPALSVLGAPHLADLAHPAATADRGLGRPLPPLTGVSAAATPWMAVQGPADVEANWVALRRAAQHAAAAPLQTGHRATRVDGDALRAATAAGSGALRSPHPLAAAPATLRTRVFMTLALWVLRNPVPANGGVWIEVMMTPTPYSPRRPRGDTDESDAASGAEGWWAGVDATSPMSTLGTTSDGMGVGSGMAASHEGDGVWKDAATVGVLMPPYEGAVSVTDARGRILHRRAYTTPSIAPMNVHFELAAPPGSYLRVRVVAMASYPNFAAALTALRVESGVAPRVFMEVGKYNHTHLMTLSLPGVCTSSSSPSSAEDDDVAGSPTASFPHTHGRYALGSCHAHGTVACKDNGVRHRCTCGDGWVGVRCSTRLSTSGDSSGTTISPSAVFSIAILGAAVMFSAMCIVGAALGALIRTQQDAVVVAVAVEHKASIERLQGGPLQSRSVAEGEGEALLGGRSANRGGKETRQPLNSASSGGAGHTATRADGGQTSAGRGGDNAVPMMMMHYRAGGIGGGQMMSSAMDRLSGDTVAV